MTYVSPRDGRQYVVVTAGGGKGFGQGDYVIAFALPERGSPQVRQASSDGDLRTSVTSVVFLLAIGSP